MNFTDPDYLEKVYAALFSLLTGATFAGGVTLKSSSRALVPPDSVPAADQPALVLVEGPFNTEQKALLTGATTARWTFTAIAAVYVRADSAAKNQNPLPITVLNYLVWGLASVFETKPPGRKQTLGGLVVNAWIEGATYPETAGEQLVLSVPIWILAGPGNS